MESGFRFPDSVLHFIIRKHYSKLIVKYPGFLLIEVNLPTVNYIPLLYWGNYLINNEDSMKKNFLILMLLISFISFLSAQDVTGHKNFPPITLTNFVEFNRPAFNNNLAGCGFLLDYEGIIYAVTCKHALWVAKTDSMKTISFGEELKEWRMRRKDDSTKYVTTGRLLNEDKTELIGEQNVDKDYLIFEIIENNSDVQPVRIRKTELNPGEEVFMTGWGFKDKTGLQRIYKSTFVKNIKNHILLENLDINLAGMSGSPLLDKNGYLVGIVSNYTQDELTKKWYISPCNTEYLLEQLKIIKEKVNQ